MRSPPYATPTAPPWVGRRGRHHAHCLFLRHATPPGHFPAAGRHSPARRRLAEHPIEEIGAKLRAMMPWISKNALVDKAKN